MTVTSNDPQEGHDLVYSASITYEEAEQELEARPEFSLDQLVACDTDAELLSYIEETPMHVSRDAYSRLMSEIVGSDPDQVDRGRVAHDILVHDLGYHDLRRESFLESFQWMAQEEVQGIDDRSDLVSVSGSNLGWRSTQGKTLDMELSEVISSVSEIDGDFTLYVEFREDNIVIKRTDHDSPTLKQANRFTVRPD